MNALPFAAAPRRVLTLLACAAMAVACSNDRRGTADEDVGLDVGLDVDAGPDAPDAVDAADGSPDAPVDALPDAPPEVEDAAEHALVVVTLAPVRAVYRPGARVTPSVAVYDADAVLVYDGAEDEGAPFAVSWTVSPDGAARLEDDGRWTLLEEGAVRFFACVPVRPGDPDTREICGDRGIVVDGGAPTIELLEPPPGAELLSDEHERIYVRGRVTDSNGALRVFVNGDRVVLDDLGNFEAFLQPEIGVNHIDVVATDGLNRLETQTGRDVLWAPRYVPAMVDEDGFVFTDVPDALLLRINQVYLDADEPVLAPPEATEVVARDLAGLLEFLLRRVDTASLVPDPVIASDAVTLRVLDVDTSQAAVDLAVTDEGLEVFATFPNVVLQTEGELNLLEEIVSLDGELTAWLSAIVSLRTEKARGGDLVVEVERLELALENAEPDFEDVEANALFELVEGALFNSLEDVLLDQVAGSLVDEIPTLVEDLLRSIDESLNGLEVPLDLGFGEPLTLRLYAGLATLQPVQRDHLLATVDTAIGVDAPPAFPDSRGSMRLLPEDQPAPLFALSRVQIAVIDGLLNGLLHTLWNAGLLELDVTSVLPDGIAILVETVTASGQLPPVLTPVRPTAAGFAFELSLGQLELTLTRRDQVEVIGATIRLGADLDVEGTSLVVRIQDEPTLDLWLIERTGDPIFEDVNALEDLVRGGIWPLIAEDLTSSLAIELPALDVSAAADIAEGVSSVEMELTLDQPVEIRQGTVVVDGAFDAIIGLEARE